MFFIEILDSNKQSKNLLIIKNKNKNNKKLYIIE